MLKLKLYCITCKRQDLSYEEQVGQACRGGADAIQFRDDELSDTKILEIGERLKKICGEKKVLFILNNRPDLALALDADGVHLGQNDIPVKWARQILGSAKIVGVSVSALGESIAAEREGASYIGLNPIFETPIKAERKALGLDIIGLIKKRVKVPVIAIGGITKDNVSEVIKAGADGVSVIRSVCGSKDIISAAKELKTKIAETEREMAKTGFLKREK
ncbi:MAG: thiamine phosphate synthase [Elusimicrobia bacterium]|nr:thiamine phosphate synthase [Elusimicrobiota bacterium]